MHQGEARWAFDDTQRSGKAPLIGGEGGAQQWEERWGFDDSGATLRIVWLENDDAADAVRANNAKSGTLHSEAKSAYRWVEELKADGSPVSPMLQSAPNGGGGENGTSAARALASEIETWKVAGNS